MTTKTDFPAKGISSFKGFEAAQARLLQHYQIKARSRFLHLKSPAMKAHLLEAGTENGEPAIILHGGDGQGVDWAPLLSILQTDLKLYAVDRPGFGLSDPFDYRHLKDIRQHAAAFVTSIMDELGLERAHLIGGSMGGYFSLCTALEHPERVQSLILVGMPLGVSDDAPLGLRLICSVPGLARRFMNNLKKKGAQGRKRQYVKMFKADIEKIPQLYFDMQEAGLRIPGAAETWAILLRKVGSWSGIRKPFQLMPELSRIHAPTLVIWGERDMVTERSGRSGVANIPGATFTVIADVGHFPFLENPEACASHIRAFMKQLITRRAEKTT